MTDVHLYADETGNLDFESHGTDGASEYFGFGTAVFNGDHGDALMEGLKLRAEASSHGIHMARGFHAVDAIGDVQPHWEASSALRHHLPIQSECLPQCPRTRRPADAPLQTGVVPPPAESGIVGLRTRRHPSCHCRHFRYSQTSDPSRGRSRGRLPSSGSNDQSVRVGIGDFVGPASRRLCAVGDSPDPPRKLVPLVRPLHKADIAHHVHPVGNRAGRIPRAGES